jgi:hypothetical protein
VSRRAVVVIITTVERRSSDGSALKGELALGFSQSQAVK